MISLIKTTLIVLAGFTAIFASAALWVYYSAGEFATISPHYDGTCVAVYGMPGAEDITVHPKTGIAFISSYDRRRYRAGMDVEGAIFAVDTTAKNPVPKKMTGGFKQEFHPHGISLYIDRDGKTLLFAINHRKAGDYVEIFEYVDGALEHRESISDPLMWRANDLQAVGPRSFYVTNDHGSHSSMGRLFEDFIPLRNAYVLYFDGVVMGYAAKGIGQANGINISPDGNTIYVAATTEKAIRVFSREPKSGSLTPSLTIPLGGFPDNIEVDHAGHLYVASMPKGLTYLIHSSNGDKLAPTQILEITHTEEGSNNVDELYVDDGHAISAATVASPFKGGMLLGPSKDKRNQVLVCRDQVDSPANQFTMIPSSFH